MIELVLEKWPPSTNKLYTVAHHRKILSPEGRAYHNYIRFEVAQAMPEALSADKAYACEMILYRRDWINKGWPGTKEKFKRFDLTNRIKCLEDGLVEALGINDSQFFCHHQEKRHGQQRIVVRIRLWDPSTSTTEPS